MQEAHTPGTSPPGPQSQPEMHPALQGLFERHVASSFDKQLFLADVIGDGGWDFDPARGVIHFADQWTWKAQVLGSSIQETGTWVWAWCDDPGMPPPEVTRVSAALRRLGQARQVPELTAPELPRGDWIAPRLAMIASGVFNARAFYRAPFPGGAAFLLIADPTFPAQNVFPPARVLSVFPQVVARYKSMNARRALLGYLKFYGLPVEAEDNALVVRQGAHVLLRATFDDQDRLTALHA